MKLKTFWNNIFKNIGSIVTCLLVTSGVIYVRILAFVLYQLTEMNKSDVWQRIIDTNQLMLFGGLLAVCTLPLLLIAQKENQKSFLTYVYAVILICLISFFIEVFVRVNTTMRTYVTTL